MRIPRKIDASKIKRAIDWGITEPEGFVDAVDNLIAAIERDDIGVAMYEDEVLGAARMLDDHYYDDLYHYYGCGGWTEDARLIS